MSTLSFIKKPVTDVTTAIKAIKDIKVLDKSFFDGDLTNISYQKKKKALKVQIGLSMSPIAITSFTVLAYGSISLLDSYLGGIPFTTIVGNNIDSLNDLITSSFDPSNKPFIESISSLDSQSLKEYANYITDGVSSMFKDIKDNHINTKFILGVVSLYSALNAVTGAINFLSGDAKTMSATRDYETENMKLNILRENFQDPVLDDLNNEEMYSMMMTFNNTLRKNHLGKGKIIKKAITFIEKYADSVITPIRKITNTSTNDKKRMINSIFEYLENDINFDDLDATYEKYGLTKKDFKILASKHGSVVKNDKINYIFDINNKAMINAYKMKLKDDTMVAFALKVEEITTSPEITNAHLKDIAKFRTFISGYEKRQVHLGSLKLPEDLKEMNKILKLFERNTINSTQEIKEEDSFKTYTSFLSKNAPHLINKNHNEEIIEINNYSFLSYFEAEKERLVKSEFVRTKLIEYHEAKKIASEENNLSEYASVLVKIENLEKEATKYNNIFGKQSIENQIIPDNLLKNVNKGISSSFIEKYSDGSQKEIIVVNMTSEKEKNLTSGKTIVRKGINVSDLIDPDMNRSVSDQFTNAEFEDLTASLKNRNSLDTLLNENALPFNSDNNKIKRSNYKKSFK